MQGRVGRKLRLLRWQRLALRVRFYRGNRAESDEVRVRRRKLDAQVFVEEQLLRGSGANYLASGRDLRQHEDAHVLPVHVRLWKYDVLYSEVPNK